MSDIGLAVPVFARECTRMLVPDPILVAVQDPVPENGLLKFWQECGRRWTWLPTGGLMHQRSR